MDQAINCIKYDAIHPDTLYMGGGPLFLRSYDEGDTFDTIYNGISGFIASLAVNPQKSNIVYVVTGVDDTVFLIYKSTDYGDNWQLLFVVNEDESNTDFIIDPLHPDTLYFGNYRSLDGGNTGKMYLTIQFWLCIHTIHKYYTLPTKYTLGEQHLRFPMIGV